MLPSADESTVDEVDHNLADHQGADTKQESFAEAVLALGAERKRGGSNSFRFLQPKINTPIQIMAKRATKKRRIPSAVKASCFARSFWSL
jgi:hypothetical protein